MLREEFVKNYFFFFVFFLSLPNFGSVYMGGKEEEGFLKKKKNSSLKLLQILKV
jgi:hypothetical protein